VIAPSLMAALIMFDSVSFAVVTDSRVQGPDHPADDYQ